MLMGADPEFFLVRNSDQKIVPASEAGLKNGKYDREVRLKTKDLEVYRDGYGMEVNFNIPHLCRGLMGNGMRRGLLEILQDTWKNKYTLSTVPAIPVDLKEIASLPADIAQFGCAPSKNAWGDDLDISGVNGLEHPWRYIGGHIWLSNSYDECSWLETDEGVEQFIRAMDYYLGIPFAYIFDRPEAYIRRKMYGRAGDYRTKQFGTRMKGVEYRVLSPEWWNHASWFSFAMGISRFLATRHPYIKHDEIKERGPEIRAAINEGRGLEKLLPERLYGFYTRDGLHACRERVDRLDWNFFAVEDTHRGWDYWSETWRLPGHSAASAGSSIDFPVAA